MWGVSVFKFFALNCFYYHVFYGHCRPDIAGMHIWIIDIVLYYTEETGEADRVYGLRILHAYGFLKLPDFQ